MPERRPHLPAFRTRPRCCTSIAGLIYAVGGLNSAGILQLPFAEPFLGLWINKHSQASRVFLILLYAVLSSSFNIVALE